MRNTTDNIAEKITSNHMLFIICLTLAMLISPVTTIISGFEFSQQVINILSGLTAVITLAGVFFIFRVNMAGRQFKDKVKLQKIFSEERELSIRQRSYSIGFYTSVIVFGTYCFAAFILNYLFENYFLIELNGILVSSYILFISYVSVYISYRVLQKQ